MRRVLGTVVILGMLVGSFGAVKAKAAEAQVLQDFQKTVYLIKASNGNTKQAASIYLLLQGLVFQVGIPMQLWVAELEKTIFILMESELFKIAKAETVEELVKNMLNSLKGLVLESDGKLTNLRVAVLIPNMPLPRAMGSLTDGVTVFW